MLYVVRRTEVAANTSPLPSSSRRQKTLRPHYSQTIVDRTRHRLIPVLQQLHSRLQIPKKMKGVSAIAVGVVALCSTADAFSANSAFSGSSMSNVVSNKASMTMEYIPSGMSKEQWMKMKNAEKNKSKGKNLGASGITTFQSRSFAEWQKAGGKNLFPVDPRNVKDASEIPYM